MSADRPGSCVDAATILYASPTAPDNGQCTAAAPCSFQQAASLVDSTHLYIVLSAGTYTAGASFESKAATIVGGGATIDMVAGRGISAYDGSLLHIRNINVNYLTNSSGVSTQGALVAILGQDSELVIDDLEATSDTNFVPLVSATYITIRHSTLSHGLVYAIGSQVPGVGTIDSCRFLDGAAAMIYGSAVISNSTFQGGSAPAISVYFSGSTSPEKATQIFNNTFYTGKGISCEEHELTSRTFESNIFFSLGAILSSSSHCIYNYNLFNDHSIPSGLGNTIGDPLFKDSTHGDFHLSPASPAIDTANPNPTVTNDHDYDGTRRPQGVRSDVGAFEYVP